MMQMVNEYKKNDIMTADGIGIVILLYDGIVDFSNRVRKALDDGDVEERTRCINKAIAIVSELDAALDMERGAEVAVNLNRLYTYMLDELARVNLDKDPARLDSVIKVVRELKEGWLGIKDVSVNTHSQKEYEPISTRL